MPRNDSNQTIRSAASKRSPWEQIEKLLSDFEFKEADDLFGHLIQYQPQAEQFFDRYERHKTKYVGEYLSQKFGNAATFDLDQLSAISTIRKNTIVSARAGSWKTQVIAGKIAYEISRWGVNPAEILALSFNSKAAQEMLERVCLGSKGFWIDDFHNAMTFHSLAYKVVRPKEEIMIDVIKYEHPVTGEEIEIDVNQQKQFIRDTFLSAFDAGIERIMTTHFPEDLADFRKTGLTEDDDAYLENRKRHENLSYAGYFVKSKWEKFLLDFLVKYGFQGIGYEPPVIIPNEHEYYLKKADAICRYPGINVPIYVEHWWLDQDDGEPPEHWSMTKEQYLENRKTKRNYYLKQERAGKIIFLETSYKDYRGESGQDPRAVFYSRTRSRFETKLRIRLESITKKELVRTMRENDRRIPDIVSRIQRYINFSQLRLKSPADMPKEIEEVQDVKIREFLALSNLVYERYEERKEELGMLDFNTLLKRAAEEIANFGDQMVIENKIDGQTVSVVEPKNLKWILIDEYQDFSTLFYHVIRAITDHNPDFKLFVVGDDWQAINQFAGADIKYFFEFRRRFDNVPTAEKMLAKNYRSQSKVVGLWNRLMKEFGDLAIPVHVSNDDVEPEILTPESAMKQYGSLADILDRCLPHGNSNVWKELGAARRAALWFMYCTIQDAKKSGPESKAFAISRNNVVYGISRDEWVRSLKKFHTALFRKKKAKESPTEFGRYLQEKRFELMTAHKSKGKQAEAVVLLDVSSSHYPRTHEELRGDAEYFSIFWETPENQIENARRLLYVGITRAKKTLRILTEKRRPSGYVQELSDASS